MHVAEPVGHVAPRKEEPVSEKKAAPTAPVDLEAPAKRGRGRPKKVKEEASESDDPFAVGQKPAEIVDDDIFGSGEPEKPATIETLRAAVQSFITTNNVAELKAIFAERGWKDMAAVPQDQIGKLIKVLEAKS